MRKDFCAGKRIILMKGGFYWLELIYLLATLVVVKQKLV